MTIVRTPGEQPAAGTPVDLCIRFDCPSLFEFAELHASDVSRGGIFIRSETVWPVGQTVKLDLQLADGSSIIAGEGTVFWTRERDASRADSEPGMGVRFRKLTAESQKALTYLLAEKSDRERIDHPVPMEVPPEEERTAPTSYPVRAAAEESFISIADDHGGDERTIVVSQAQLLASAFPDRVRAPAPLAEAAAAPPAPAPALAPAAEPPFSEAPAVAAGAVPADPAPTAVDVVPPDLLATVAGSAPISLRPARRKSGLGIGLGLGGLAFLAAGIAFGPSLLLKVRTMTERSVAAPVRSENALPLAPRATTRSYEVVPVSAPPAVPAVPAVAPSETPPAPPPEPETASAPRATALAEASRAAIEPGAPPPGAAPTSVPHP